MSAPKIPKEQWAQVIEKVGGPVEYKKIPVAEPGPGEVSKLSLLFGGGSGADSLFRSSLTSSTPVCATLISTPSTVTGPSRPNYRLSVATRVPVLSWPVAPVSPMKMQRLARPSV